MFRILASFLNILTAAVILLPVMFLYKKLSSQSLKRTLYYIVFSFYLVAVYSITGMPSVSNLTFDLTVNLIPITTMAEDAGNCVLNVILFLPLGIFLPLLWNSFASLKHIFLYGLSQSLFIEVLQIFTYRATDVNDLITNTLGAVIGYYIVMIFRKKKQLVAPDSSLRGLYLINITVFAVMFFVQPYLSSLFWNILL